MSFQGDRVPSVTFSLVEFDAAIRSSCNGGVSARMQRLRNKLTGHAIDPDSLLHEGVLGVDYHAVRQKTIFVSTITPLTSINFSGY